MPRTSENRFAGRIALITGASSGIGRAAARLFVAHGARVALLGRRPAVLAELAAELGDGAVAVPADVADPDAVTAAVDETIRVLGGLDIVVNSAGVAEPTALRELDAAAWSRTIDVDLSGTFYVSRAAGLWMADHDGGVIVNVSSGMAVVGSPMFAAYCAAKAGVNGLTRALAMELAPSVRVVAVCPGAVDTPMLDAELAVFGMTSDALAGTVPLRRVADVDEVADAILFVVADARYMTGATLMLDGGATASL